MRVLSLLVWIAITTATTYRLTVYAPGTTIDGAKLDASGFAFYTGLSSPATYCPINVISDCPPVLGTLVFEGLSAMAVQVPGGQFVYVDPSGLVSYAQAHSTYYPNGSYIGGWFNKTVVSDCAPTIQVLDFLTNDGSDVGGILLCPDIPDWMLGSGASYRLYATTPDFNTANCIEAVGLIQHGNADNFGCWEYT
ncbi:hypothetical protein BX600DRAFT_549642 [Xylariales sp. PMI_506]|nr:hypothetical protein BX600DRAFT_549642 [Xylariales sp. PMI_506]